jgi:hypothetical protein
MAIIRHIFPDFKSRKEEPSFRRKRNGHSPDTPQNGMRKDRHQIQPAESETSKIQPAEIDLNAG